MNPKNDLILDITNKILCDLAAHKRFNTLRLRQNGRHFPDDIFICTEVCSQGSNQCSSIGSDNGLMPVRRQAIIWINGGLDYSGIYTSLGHNELRYITDRHNYTEQCFHPQISLSNATLVRDTMDYHICISYMSFFGAQPKHHLYRNTGNINQYKLLATLTFLTLLIYWHMLVWF